MVDFMKALFGARQLKLTHLALNPDGLFQNIFHSTNECIISYFSVTRPITDCNLLYLFFQGYK